MRCENSTSGIHSAYTWFYKVVGILQYMASEIQHIASIHILLERKQSSAAPPEGVSCFSEVFHGKTED